MNVLGLKIAGHDTGAAIFGGGKPVAIAEERLSREKHSMAFPHLAIEYCLTTAGLTPDDIDLVVLDHTSKEKGKTSAELFTEKTGSRYKAPIRMIGHHDAHAAAAFFCSPYSEAAILVYDGNGDFFKTNLGVVGAETESLYRGKDSSIAFIDKTLHAKSSKRFPYSSGIGILYERLSRDYLDFGLGNEGKMMGLAAYGDDSFLKQFPYERWVQDQYGRLMCNSRISFLQLPSTWTPTVLYYGIRMRVKRFIDSAKRRVISYLARDILTTPDLLEPIYLPRSARRVPLPEPYYNSVAYAAQKIFERFSITLGKRLKAVTQSDTLCVAGGCALNIDANRNFITEVGFKNLFVQPASSDCGIALGCALWGYHMILKQPRAWEMKSASLGRGYSLKEIDDAIRMRDVDVVVSKKIAKDAAKLIAEGKIIGWFSGGSEYGPRALGNRSIICDARHPEMRDILNKRVKHREMWRPFAASILAEKLGEWFDLEPNATTAFMLLAAPIHQRLRGKVPSIVHVDGTCRMQTLTKENGAYYDLVKEFDALTGTPLILNTSFNLGGDPIVETPADALDTFLKTDMDYLVLENRIVTKRS
jgi:carbamoyltransferase